MNEVVLVLLEQNADISIKNNNGKTAGEEAFDRGFYEISEKIAEKEPATDIIEEEEDENN